MQKAMSILIFIFLAETETKGIDEFETGWKINIQSKGCKISS